jgi:23S rRNA pseudouridine2604 synthase
MSEGVEILGKKTIKCKVEKLKSTEFKIILTQGLNRQIRRMCEYFDFRVVALQRVRIMNIKLDIKEGKYRLLNDKEIAELIGMLKNK